MRVAVEPDVELEYEVLGSGPELVWLHGLSGCLEESRPIAERLASDYRVLWYSTRGHGRSSPLADRTRYDYGRVAADLDAVLDHVGFTRPLIAGGSHGANTALRHEVLFPGRARALCLIAPGRNALRRPPWAKFAVLRFGLWRATRGGMDGLITLGAGAHPDSPDADPLVVAAMRTHDFDSIRVAMRRIADQQVVDPALLPSFTVPTHVAAWADDPIVHPIAMARQIAALIPGATFEQIDRVADLPSLVVADRAADLVSAWAERALAATP